MKTLSFWKPFCELNPAIDEHADMPNTIGLFVNRRCLLGMVVRLSGDYRPYRYHPELAVIINNWTFGLWREPR